MGSSVRRFGDYFVQSVVRRTAETAFKKGVRDFCTHFTPQAIQRVAESGEPFQDVIARCGFKIKPTRAQDLNPWQRYMVGLSDRYMLDMVKEVVSPEHVVMLDKYPMVAQGIIATVRGMVVSS
jgi:hypothetical protein